MIATNTKIPLCSNEGIVLDTAANALRSGFYMGGRLYLTAERLCFKSHWFNLHSYVLDIPLSDLQSFAPFKKHLFLLGAVVTKRNGEDLYFVMQLSQVLLKDAKKLIGNAYAIYDAAFER